MFVVVAVFMYGVAFVFLWHPVLSEVRAGHGSLTNSIKDFALGDQLTYLSIARNVQDGRHAYIEPFTSTGSSIYPSAYYWFLGMFARATSTNPLFAWNVIGMSATAGLMLMIGKWGRWASNSILGWLTGPVVLLFGGLEWYMKGHWRADYGAGGVLWPPFVILFNPGAETPALILAAGSLFCLVRALEQDGTNFRWLLAAGALAGLAMNIHTYVSLFIVTTTSATILMWLLLSKFDRRSAVTAAISVAVSWAVVLSGVIHSNTGKFVVVLAGLLVPVLAAPRWRREFALSALVFFGSLAVAAAPLLARIAADLTRPVSYFTLRQRSAAQLDLSLPWTAVAFVAAPLIVLVVTCLVSLLRQRRDPHKAAWACAVIAATFASILLTFNAAWGMNQEPYRFYPYSIVFLLMLSIPWLVMRGLVVRARWRHVALRVALAGTLAASAPTAWVFFKDPINSKIFRIAPGERQTWQAVANAVPSNGLTLLDQCISNLAIKVSTGMNIAGYSFGLAVPDRYPEISQVLAASRAGTLASGSELARAGISSYVSMNYCNSYPSAELHKRFGDPIATIPYRNPEQCGMPRDTTYTVYATASDTGNSTTRAPNYDPQQPFRTARDGSQVASTAYPCAVGHLF